jgi:hypothetical protein
MAENIYDKYANNASSGESLLDTESNFSAQMNNEPAGSAPSPTENYFAKNPIITQDPVGFHVSIDPLSNPTDINAVEDAQKNTALLRAEQKSQEEKKKKEQQDAQDAAQASVMLEDLTNVTHGAALPKKYTPEVLKKNLGNKEFMDEFKKDVVSTGAYKEHDMDSILNVSNAHVRAEVKKYLGYDPVEKGATIDDAKKYYEEINQEKDRLSIVVKDPNADLSTMKIVSQLKDKQDELIDKGDSIAAWDFFKTNIQNNPDINDMYKSITANALEHKTRPSQDIGVDPFGDPVFHDDTKEQTMVQRLHKQVMDYKELNKDAFHDATNITKAKYQLSLDKLQTQLDELKGSEQNRIYGKDFQSTQQDQLSVLAVSSAVSAVKDEMGSMINLSSAQMHLRHLQGLINQYGEDGFSGTAFGVIQNIQEINPIYDLWNEGVKYNAVSKLVKGEKLSDTDSLFLKAMTLSTSAESIIPTSIGYEIGKSLPNNIGFMISLAASGGLEEVVNEGVTKGLKLGLRNWAINGAEGSVVKSLAKYTQKWLPEVAGLIAGSLAVTPLQPMTYSGLLQEKTGVIGVEGDPSTDDFHYDTSKTMTSSLSRAIYKGFVNSFIQTASEGIGEFTQEPIANLTKNMTSKSPLVQGLISAYNGSRTAGFLKTAQWHGFLNEMFEEFVGNVMQLPADLASDDPQQAMDNFTSWFSPRNLLITAGSLGVFSAAGGTQSLRRAIILRDHIRDSYSNISTFLGADQANEFKNGFNALNTINDRAKYLNDFVGVNNFDAKQISDLWKYTTFVTSSDLQNAAISDAGGRTMGVADLKSDAEKRVEVHQGHTEEVSKLLEKYDKDAFDQLVKKRDEGLADPNQNSHKVLANFRASMAAQVSSLAVSNDKFEKEYKTLLDKKSESLKGITDTKELTLQERMAEEYNAALFKEKKDMTKSEIDAIQGMRSEEIAKRLSTVSNGLITESKNRTQQIAENNKVIESHEADLKTLNSQDKSNPEILQKIKELKAVIDLRKKQNKTLEKMTNHDFMFTKKKIELLTSKVSQKQAIENSLLAAIAERKQSKGWTAEDGTVRSVESSPAMNNIHELTMEVDNMVSNDPEKQQKSAELNKAITEYETNHPLSAEDKPGVKIDKVTDETVKPGTKVFLKSQSVRNANNALVQIVGTVKEINAKLGSFIVEVVGKNGEKSEVKISEHSQAADWIAYENKNIVHEQRSVWNKLNEARISLLSGRAEFGQRSNEVSKEEMQPAEYTVKQYRKLLLDRARNSTEETVTEDQIHETTRMARAFKAVSQLFTNTGVKFTIVESDPTGKNRAGWQQGKHYVVNMGVANEETGLHELAHPILDSIETGSPELFNRLLSEVMDSNDPEMKKIIREVNDKYKEKTMAYRQKEMIVTAIGQRNEILFKGDVSPFAASIYRMYNGFMSWVRSKMGLPQIQLNTTLDELAQDIAKGRVSATTISDQIHEMRDKITKTFEDKTSEGKTFAIYHFFVDEKGVPVGAQVSLWGGSFHDFALNHEAKLKAKYEDFLSKETPKAEPVIPETKHDTPVDRKMGIMKAIKNGTPVWILYQSQSQIQNGQEATWRKIDSGRISYDESQIDVIKGSGSSTDNPTFNINKSNFKDFSLTDPTVKIEEQPVSTEEVPIQEKSYEDARKEANSRPGIPQNVNGKVPEGKNIRSFFLKTMNGLGLSSIEMIMNGERTRTTRSQDQMNKQNLKVGDYVNQFGYDREGNQHTVLTRVTDIYDNKDPRFLGNWNKEGWADSERKSIETGHHSYAIEFELVKNISIDETKKALKAVEDRNQNNFNRILPEELGPDHIVKENNGEPTVVYRGYGMKEDRLANSIEETIAGTAEDYIAPGIYFTSSESEAEEYATGRTNKSMEYTTEYPEGKIGRHYTGDFAKVSAYNLVAPNGVLIFKNLMDFMKNKPDDLTGFVIKLEEGTLAGAAEWFVSDKNQIKEIKKETPIEETQNTGSLDASIEHTNQIEEWEKNLPTPLFQTIEKAIATAIQRINELYDNNPDIRKANLIRRAVNSGLRVFRESQFYISLPDTEQRLHANIFENTITKILKKQTITTDTDNKAVTVESMEGVAATSEDKMNQFRKGMSKVIKSLSDQTGFKKEKVEKFLMQMTKNEFMVNDEEDFAKLDSKYTNEDHKALAQAIVKTVDFKKYVSMENFYGSLHMEDQIGIKLSILKGKGQGRFSLNIFSQAKMAGSIKLKSIFRNHINNLTKGEFDNIIKHINDYRHNDAFRGKVNNRPVPILNESKILDSERRLLSLITGLDESVVEAYFNNPRSLDGIYIMQDGKLVKPSNSDTFRSLVGKELKIWKPGSSPMPMKTTAMLSTLLSKLGPSKTITMDSLKNEARKHFEQEVGGNSNLAHLGVSFASSEEISVHSLWLISYTIRCRHSLLILTIRNYRSITNRIQ